MPRRGRPARRAVSRRARANEKNPALSVDRKPLGTSKRASHPARPVPAVAPHGPRCSADACRSAIGRPILKDSPVHGTSGQIPIAYAIGLPGQRSRDWASGMWDELGAARAREPALLSPRSQDGGAEKASSERRAGCPERASGDGHGQPRAGRLRRLKTCGHLKPCGHLETGRSPSLTRLGFLGRGFGYVAGTAAGGLADGDTAAGGVAKTS